MGLGRKLHQCPLLAIENPERGENDEIIHNRQGRISNLLEPNFERGVEDGNERNGLLTRTLSYREEVGLVLSGDELSRPCGILLEKLLDEYMRLVERGKRLKN